MTDKQTDSQIVIQTENQADIKDRHTGWHTSTKNTKGNWTKRQVQGSIRLNDEKCKLLRKPLQCLLILLCSQTCTTILHTRCEIYEKHILTFNFYNFYLPKYISFTNFAMRTSWYCRQNLRNCFNKFVLPFLMQHSQLLPPGE